MINSIYEDTQTIEVGGNVIFNSDVVRTRCFNCRNGFEHNDNSGLFTLSKCGIYEILFNANISSPSAGAISLAIASNGEVLPGTQMDYTVTDATIFGNVSASRLVRICNNSSKTITITNNGTLPVTAENSSIIIKKVA